MLIVSLVQLVHNYIYHKDNEANKDLLSKAGIKPKAQCKSPVPELGVAPDPPLLHPLCFPLSETSFETFPSEMVIEKIMSLKKSVVF